MKYLTAQLVCLAVLFAWHPQTAFSQGIHPKKQIFRDVANWPLTSPSTQTKLKNFKPFHAVYNRSYKQASGAKRGELRNDKVIVTANEVGWDGRRGVAITIIDSGIVDQRDTNARASTMFVDRKNLSLIFEIGPVPGTAKDYYIARVNQDNIKFSQVDTNAQKLSPKQMSTRQLGFGPTTWAMASSKLSAGQKLNLGPTLTSGNSLTSTSYGHVVGKSKFKDGNGNEIRAWVVETSKNLVSPKVSHVYLSDKPPYYLGTETVDLVTGDRSKFVWLDNVQMLGK